MLSQNRDLCEIFQTGQKGYFVDAADLFDVIGTRQRIEKDGLVIRQAIAHGSAPNAERN